MNKEDVLKGFDNLSPEDQAAVRERLSFDPMSMCKTMMGRIQSGGDPMTICKDMMKESRGKCC